MASLTDRIVAEIEGGRFEEADALVQSLRSLAKDPATSPSICNPETLDALRKARNLALIQRSHIQQRIRSLNVRRLYPTQPELLERSTWRIDA